MSAVCDPEGGILSQKVGLSSPVVCLQKIHLFESVLLFASRVEEEILPRSLGAILHLVSVDAVSQALALLEVLAATEL